MKLLSNILKEKPTHSAPRGIMGFLFPNPDPKFYRVPNHRRRTYTGRVTWVVPMGTISMDLPQNLFFHLTSEMK